MIPFQKKGITFASRKLRSQALLKIRRRKIYQKHFKSVSAHPTLSNSLRDQGSQWHVFQFKTVCTVTEMDSVKRDAHLGSMQMCQMRISFMFATPFPYRQCRTVSRLIDMKAVYWNILLLAWVIILNSIDGKWRSFAHRRRLKMRKSKLWQFISSQKCIHHIWVQENWKLRSHLKKDLPR